MAPSFSDIVEEARLSARALLDYGDSFFNPTVRLGVTGLSRAGKTVFITALIHGLTRGGRFPIFEPYATGRIARARLAPQPDDAVPRFAYENHVRTLIEERRWPSSTATSANCASSSTTSARTAPTARSPSTSSITPANGCWICRCSTRVLSNGRRRASRCRARARAQSSPRRGMSISRRFSPRAAEDEQAGACRRQTVHRLFARLPRRTLCDEPAAARALS